MVWDLAGAKPPSRLSRHDNPVHCVAFHPDGRTLFSCSSDHVCQWAIATGEILRDFPQRASNLQSMAVAPDGRSLAVITRDGTIFVWDTASGNQRSAYPGHRAAVSAVVFSPDVRFVVSAGLDGMIAWDLDEKHAMHRFGDRLVLATTLAFLPDRKSLLVGSLSDAPQLWDPITGKLIRDFDGPQHSHRLRLSPDGKLAISLCRDDRDAGGPANILLWDTARGALLGSIDSWDEKGGITEHRSFGGLNDVSASAQYSSFAEFERDGKRLWLGNMSGTIRRWTVSGQFVGTEKGEWGNAGAFSPDGRVLATSRSGHVIFYDSPSRKRTGEFRAPRESDEFRDRPLAFSPDGRTLAVAGDGGIVRFCEVATRKERRRLQGHEGQVRALSFSADGRTLGTGSDDTTVIVWDVLYPKAKAIGMAEAWAALAEEDCERAYEAMCQLVAAPEAAVRFMSARVRRAIRLSAEQMDKLVADLDSDSFETREQAMQAILAIGTDAVTALARALKDKPSLEMRRRAEALLAQLQVEFRVPTGNALRQLRVLEVLEHIATRDAVRIIEELAAGVPEARLTIDAQAAVRRVKARQSLASRGGQ